MAINVSPTDILAPMEFVWSVIVDFNSYTEYNPFHRRVRVLLDPSTNHRKIEMAVNLLNPTAGSLPSPESCFTVPAERIFYVDARADCCILLCELLLCWTLA